MFKKPNFWLRVQCLPFQKLAVSLATICARIENCADLLRKNSLNARNYPLSFYPSWKTAGARLRLIPWSKSPRPLISESRIWFGESVRGSIPSLACAFQAACDSDPKGSWCRSGTTGSPYLVCFIESGHTSCNSSAKRKPARAMRRRAICWASLT